MKTTKQIINKFNETHHMRLLLASEICPLMEEYKDQYLLPLQAENESLKQRLTVYEHMDDKSVITHLRERINQLEPKWISIHDSLPNAWERVLILEDKCRRGEDYSMNIGWIDEVEGGQYDNGTFDWWHCHELGDRPYPWNNVDFLEITHWATFPNIPKGLVRVKTEQIEQGRSKSYKRIIK